MTARRRILLAELTPKIPQPPVFGTWSATDKHADIALNGGNLTASKSTTDAVAWACVRGTVPVRAGQWYWETTVNYTGAADFGVGLAWHSTDGLWLNGDPGVTAAVGRGIGVAVNKAGLVRSAGDKLGSLGAIGSGAVVRHWLDMDALVYRMALGSGPWIDVVPFDGFLTWPSITLRPIAGLLRPAGTTGSITANFGATPFAYPVPDGANPGVYTVPALVMTTLYLGSEGFDALLDSGPVHYHARIAGDQDVEIEREGSCWVWGGQSISRRGQLSVINADGGCDAWRDYVWRDADVVLMSGYAGDDRSAFSVWGYSRVDAVEFARDSRIVLQLADPVSWLDRPIQSALYPADQPNAQAAGQPLPIVYGEPLYCAPVRLDTAPTVRNYQLHDAVDPVWGLTAMAGVFDNGNRFSGPDDAYTPHDAITAANGGDFTGWAGSPALPTGWTRQSNTPFGPNDLFLQASGGGLRCLSTYQAATAIFHSGGSLQAGRRYRMTFDVSAVAKAGTLIFRAVSVDAPFAFTTAMVGTAQSLVLDTREAAQLQLVMQGGALDVSIRNLRVSTERVVDWTWWESSAAKRGFVLANALAGKVTANPVSGRKTLDTIANDIAARVAVPALPMPGGGAPLPGIDVSTLDALSLSPPYELATYLDKPKTGLALLREMLDGWCGWVTSNRLGQIVVGRVEEPSNTPVLTLDETRIVGDVQVSTDRAAGLSLRLAGARNHSPHSDGEIATSVSAERRAELQAEYTLTATGAAPLAADAVSPAYAQAINAPAKPTLLRRAAHLLAEANRVATLWRRARSFYLVSVLLDANAADQLEPGQTVRLVWSRWGLAGGKNLLVVGVRSRFFSRRVDLKLWG